MDFSLLQILLLLMSSQQQQKKPAPVDTSCKVANFLTEQDFDMRSFNGYWYVALRTVQNYGPYYPIIDNLKVVYYLDNDRTLRVS